MDYFSLSGLQNNPENREILKNNNKIKTQSGQ